MADMPEPKAAETAPKPGGKRRTRTVLFAGGPLLVLLGAGYWYASTGRYVSTENAYVKFDILRVSPNVGGRVTSIHVRPNQRLRKGQVMFRIDAAPYRIRLATARASALETLNKIAADKAAHRQAKAELAQENTRTAFYRKALDRQQNLIKKGISSAANLDKAQLNYQVSLRKVRLLEEKISVALAKIGGDASLKPRHHPLYLRNKAARDQAQLDLEDTVVRASNSGIVSNLTLQVGQNVRAGVPLFSLINTAKVWVDVHLKETDLTHVKVGQAATVEVDALPDRKWRARVESIAPATGAEFAILPPQNASGNWVKVVRRLTVRLAFFDQRARQILRAGMSASVAIDTGRERPLNVWIRSALGGGSKSADKGAKK
jgi:membrane fusion protein (multidrug efflux system)